MRHLLLDTCAVLRLANGEFKKFSKGAMKALREADILYVSPISEWEISLKWRDGGIDLPMPPRDLMRTLVDAYSLSLIPLSEEVMFKATELPEVHRRPLKESLWTAGHWLRRPIILRTKEDLLLLFLPRLLRSLSTETMSLLLNILTGLRKK